MNNTDVFSEINSIAHKAFLAKNHVARASLSSKNKALQQIADDILHQQDLILKANNKDVALAKEMGLCSAMCDRLILTTERIRAMATAVQNLIKLPDPVGRVLANWHVEHNDLNIERVSVPIGTIGIIYESRPNVTIDAATLCLKSGNSVILRGGSESFHSSAILVEIIQNSLKKVGFCPDAVQYIPTKDRKAVQHLLSLEQYIDLIIPRGGKGLIKTVLELSKIPSLQHLDGNCHTYIHQDADLAKATKILLNAKLRRVGICGATESMVIDEAIAEDALASLTPPLIDNNVEVRGCELSCQIDDRITKASKEDFFTEYLDKIISVKIVKNLDEAIDFINLHSSAHTDCIITENKEAQVKFQNSINSAIVMHNTSTQFADGGEFGMGAEIGIATGKLHARGPVGLEQLNIFKYIVKGNGQTRA